MGNALSGGIQQGIGVYQYQNLLDRGINPLTGGQMGQRGPMNAIPALGPVNTGFGFGFGGRF
jgi:hypothetical protein